MSASLTATDPDSDALTFSKTTDPAHGSITSFSPNGAFVYKPHIDFSGADSFSVRVADSAGNSVAATLSLTVSAVNDAPTIRNDFIRLAAADVLSVDVLANDSDPDGDSLTVTIDQQPTIGTAAVSAGIVNLTMPTGFQGFTRFSYRAADAAGLGQVMSAVVFAGTEPFQLAYVTDEQQGDRNLYIDDLLARRPINFAGGQHKVVGRFEPAANGQLVVFDECVASCGTGQFSQTGDIYVAPAAEAGVTRVVNHSRLAGERIAYRSHISPDGNWLAYATIDPSNTVRLYVANLTPTGAATQVPLPANRVLSSDQFTTLTMGPSSLYVYFTLSAGPALVTRETYRAELRNPANVSRPTNSVSSATRLVDFVATNASETAIFQGVLAGAQRYLERVEAADPGTAVVVSPVFNATQNATWYFSADRQQLVFLESTQSPASTTVWLGDTSGASAPQSVATIAGLAPVVQVIAFHPSGSHVLVTGFGGLFDVSLSQGNLPSQISPSSPTTCYQECSRYDASGNYVVYSGDFAPAGQSATFGVWRADRPSLTSHWLALGFVPFNMRFSPDGNALASIETGPNNQGFRLFLRNMTLGSHPLQLTGVIDPTSYTFDAQFLRRP